MFKRIFDFVLSFILIVLLLPFFLLISLAIRLFIGNPIFFFQERPGLNGSSFRMIKFRTMTDECNANGELLPDIYRLTKFGKFLRATSLDELPELLNVLKGDMSFVGPRPLLMEYLSLYNTNQLKRHNVRPGITGWAQVNGRNAISWEQKFEYDLWYINNHSFWLDIKILLLTIKSVMFCKGINAEGNATMPKFNGSK